MSFYNGFYQPVLILFLETLKNIYNNTRNIPSKLYEPASNAYQKAKSSTVRCFLFLLFCCWYIRFLSQHVIGNFFWKMYKKPSSRPEVSCKNCVLRNFAKSTGKHLRQNLFFSKVSPQGKTQFSTSLDWNRSLAASEFF